MNANIDPSIFNLAIEGQQNSGEAFDYTIKKSAESNQEFDVKFNFKDDLKDENIVVSTTQNPENLLFDENRNLLYSDTGVAELDRVCYVSEDRSDIMRLLAYIVLWGFVVVTGLLILMTCFCWKRNWDIAAAWKYLIHHWMKLQLVAFFALFAIYMPCCIKEFLHQLYKWAVSWDHGMRDSWDDTYEDSSSYNLGFTKKTLNENMEYENVKAFFLHNFGVFFIVHLFIFVIYIIVVLWDKIKDSTNGSFMYRVLNYMQFSLMIAFFMLVDMQIFAFSFINIRKAYFKHSYFVFCFIICVAYLAVFLMFWLYSFSCLMLRTDFLNYPTNHNSMYFFLAGYKENNKAARAYDLWHLIIRCAIGAMIGLLMYQAFA